MNQVQNNHQKVVVAMSGGVDSTVSALLLQQAGYELSGITMLLHDASALSQEAIFETTDIKDAKHACASLGITHTSLDYRELFCNQVKHYFANSYLHGLTPNPCIACNKRLKFEALHHYRQEQGAHYIATGHYANRVFNKETGLWELLTANDIHKDQSYVLYQMTQDQLAHTLFPLGSLSKEEVRNCAEKAHFANARKSESQDICFIPNGDYVSFITNFVGEEYVKSQNQPGTIVDSSGSVLGTHSGLLSYTIGQRKGIGIAYSEPLYVLNKDTETNTLVVGPKHELLTLTILVQDVSFISGAAAACQFHASFKTSYRQFPIPGIITCHENNTATVELETPIITPAPGQSCVIYAGNIVLGGGIIKNDNHVGMKLQN